MTQMIYTLVNRDPDIRMPLISTEHRHMLPTCLKVLTDQSLCQADRRLEYFTLYNNQLKDLLIFADSDLQSRSPIPLNAAGDSPLLYVHTLYIIAP